MKSNFLSEFVNKAKDNPKTAFICKRGQSNLKVSFKEFLSDVYQMNNYLSKNLMGDRVLIFSYPYSYLFFVGIFSCVFLGKDIVIVDSFGDRDKLKSMLDSAHVTDVLTDKFTSFLSFLIPGKRNKLNLTSFKKYDSYEFLCDSASIITFTSGTTGTPKMIKRNLDFLASQIQLIQNNVKIFDEDLTYGLLPMYTLFSVLMLHTSLVSRKINDCQKFNVSMLLAPIKKIQKIKNPIHSVQRVFLGGAILYKKETEEILSKFPNAEITYVYGASEGAIIYKTKLLDYKNSLFTFNSRSNGIDVEILNPDSNGIGEILIKGDTVIGENHQHNTGDYGKLVEGKLIIVGRKKYSCSEISFYNYEFDENLRKDNPEIKNGFSFYYKNQIHVVYQGKITSPQKNVIYHPFKKLPFDLKHKTKLDYGKVILILQQGLQVYLLR